MNDVGPAQSDAPAAPLQNGAAGSAAPASTDGALVSLASITQSGLPLAAGLQACAEESSSNRDARELRRLARFVERGGTLEEAASRPSRRATVIWPLLAAGVRSGRLPQILEAYLLATRQNRTLWRRFWISLMYPAVVFWVGIALLSLGMLFVVPMFRDIFSDFGLELPLITLVLLNVSQYLQATWPFIAVFGGLLTIGLITAPWLPTRRVCEWLPFVGTASLRAGASDFCSLLAVFVDAGTPLHEAVSTVGRSSKSARLKRRARELAKRLQAGADPREAANSIRQLPLEIKSAFRWAGERDRFVTVLRQTARSLAAQARVNVMQIGFVVEPLAIVLLGTISGFVVIGLFMPLIRLLNDLS